MDTMQEYLTEKKEWKALEKHFAEIRDSHLRGLFAADPGRAAKFRIQDDDLYLDYSKNRITGETMELLVNLARSCRLEEEIENMFTGKHINETEDRAVLHIALRNRSNNPIIVDGHDVMPGINAVLDKMKSCADSIRHGQWKGHTGKPVQHIVISASAVQTSVRSWFAKRSNHIPDVISK
jgi:glucose-6-phosphate isomerase